MGAASKQFGRVAVLGAGAVGAHLGALLSRGGADVTLIGRPQVLDPMASGVTILRPGGASLLASPKVVTDRQEIGRFDWVLLTVKAYAVASALDQLDDLLATDGLVLAFQNGVGSDSFLIERFGSKRIVAVTSTISVGIDQPGSLAQYTDGGMAWAASADSTPVLDGAIEALLARAGFPVTRIPSVESLRWSKLLLNAVGSAQSAILGVDLAAIVRDPRLFRIEQLAFRERLRVMAAAGIDPIDLPGFRVRLAARLMGLPVPVARAVLGRRMARGRGDKSPTLRADAERGGPTENQFLIGATVRLGADTGVKTPVNETLTRLVDEVTADEHAREIYRSQPNYFFAKMQKAGIKGIARPLPD